MARTVFIFNHQNNLKVVLFILSALLVLLNVLGFYTYRYAHPGDTSYAQAWGYLESDLFELVTISLVFPIIIIVLENHFKFIQSMLENRLKREEVIRAEKRALLQKQREEHSEKRWEVIALTENMLTRLFNLAVEIQYIPIAENKAASKKDTQLSQNEPEIQVRNILKSLAEFGATSNCTVNMWTTRLNISSDDEKMFLYFINLVLHCSADIAQYILSGGSRKEILELQAALGIIWGEIKRISHQAIITILKRIAEKIELCENKANRNSIKIKEEEINQYRAALTAYFRYIKNMENEVLDPLPEISGKSVDAMRDELSNLKTFLKENPDKGFQDFNGRVTIYDLYYHKIPRTKRFHALAREYSNENIKHLAEVLGCERLIAGIVEKAR